MYRKILTDLTRWKSKTDRKPLILTGARQVGKTYSLKAFGKSEYPKAHYLNFEAEVLLEKIFEKDFKPARIISEINFHLGTSINIEHDLLIFDEIQNAPRAITSLKYFAEEMPQLSLCCAGSLLGLHLNESHFPVGKVNFLAMAPMSFEEFLLATDDERSFHFLDQYTLQDAVPPLIHDHLWQALKSYLVVGGLPEVVLAFASQKHNTFQAFENTRVIQHDLITAYLADVAKHSGKINSMHIDRLWKNIPAQLARTQDGSASKFIFKNVVPGVHGYERLVGAIDWLKMAGLVYKLPIVNKAWLPLQAYSDESIFKLYLFDIGLLGALGGVTPKLLIDFDFGSYKGFIAENFVLQEMNTAAILNMVAWKEKTAEVEFLFDFDGKVLPIEVKSGWVTHAKSLKVFAEKYHPPYRITLSAKNVSVDKTNGILHLPLYLASRIPKLLASLTHA